MFFAIKASLVEAIEARGEMSDVPKDKLTVRWKRVEAFLKYIRDMERQNEWPLILLSQILPVYNKHGAT